MAGNLGERCGELCGTADGQDLPVLPCAGSSRIPSARVVIHWRYALNDAFYAIAGHNEDARGEWCDEFYTIYPDQVGVRRMELHYTMPERKHDWVEQIVLLPPGKYPTDVIDKASVTLVNMKGETADYTWDEKLKVEMPEPRGANMSFVNLKSANRPFIIVSPNPVETVEGKWDSPYFRTYGSQYGERLCGRIRCLRLMAGGIIGRLPRFRATDAGWSRRIIRVTLT